MAGFFKAPTIWVNDFRYDGRPSRWFKAFGPDVDLHEQMADQLRQLCDSRALLAQVRRATEAEELQTLRGDERKNPWCPTGRNT